jgi:cyclase
MKKLALCMLVAGAARAQMPDPSKAEIRTHTVAGSVSMLEGAGGNIGVSAGDDGVFVIDDEFAPLAPKIKAAIAKISAKPLRFVFNTHWHGDHTGANEAMAGFGALIVAHDNVRKRMSVEQVMELFGGHKIPPSPPNALPVVTFSDELTFHLNGDEIHVFHVANAHTDGDAIVHFKKANVVHMGDCFINHSYPVVDFSTGGSIDGLIAAEEKVLAMVDANTRIIPGHGPIGDKTDLQKMHDLIKEWRDAVAKAAVGKTLEETVAAKPTAKWDAQYANPFISGDVLTTMIYKTLPKAVAKAKTKK